MLSRSVALTRLLVGARFNLRGAQNRTWFDVARVAGCVLH
jgi:hypothetical protein